MFRTPAEPEPTAFAEPEPYCRGSFNLKNRQILANYMPK